MKVTADQGPTLFTRYRIALLSVLGFMTAFCSIVYELYLAQMLATTMGGTNLRYALTIGIYLASMGLGSLICARFKDQLGSFIKLEMILTVIGLTSPIIFIYTDLFATRMTLAFPSDFVDFIGMLVTYGVNHFLIILIGVLSGMELPLLMDMAEDAKKSYTVLAIDFFGTVVGAISFPLILYPYFGIINVAMFTAAINVFAVLLLLTVIKWPIKHRFSLMTYTLVLAMIVGWIYHNQIETFLIDTYIRG